MKWSNAPYKTKERKINRKVETLTERDPVLSWNPPERQKGRKRDKQSAHATNRVEDFLGNLLVFADKRT